MKEYIDQEMTKVEEVEVRPNSRFDRGNDKENDALEEDLPLGTIHIGGLNHFYLENKIQGEICII